MEPNNLATPGACNKAKTWIVPLKFTVMVDDPTQYDFQMEKVLKQVLSELKSIVSGMDRGQGHFHVDYGEIQKNGELPKTPELPAGKSLQDMIAEEIKKALGK